MSSLAIDSRPKTFDEVVGHKSTVLGLKNLIKSGNIPVGLMLVGPTGSGKTTLARIFAKEIDGQILEVNSANENGVDDARELARQTAYNPLTGQYRVFILDEGHALSVQAQNALLKPLETPGRSVFIFPTTDPQKFLPALKSRCTTFILKPFGYQETTELVRRLDPQNNHLAFIDALVSAEITSARDIINCFEKLSSGLSIEESIIKTEKTEYVDISRAIINGYWEKSKQVLRSTPVSEFKSVRSVVAGYARYALLEEKLPAKADALAEFLKNISIYTNFEDGIAFGAFVSSVYTLSKKLRG